jgi:hypothetical protein
MFTKEQRQEKTNELTQIIDEILSLNVEKNLIRKEELGSQLNFEEYKGKFNEILLNTKKIKNFNLDVLIDNFLEKLLSQFRALKNSLDSIKNFDPQEQSSNKKNIENDFLSRYNTWFENIYSIIIFLDYKNLNFENIKIEADKVKNEIEKIKLEVEGKNKDLEEVLKKAKQSAGEIGVASYADFFGDEAKEHKKISWWWFGAVILTTLLTIGWGVVLFFWTIDQDATVAESIQIALAKLVVLSTLYYSIVWTTKNYNAHNHNSIVNKHRKNSLNSFETFIKASEDDQQTKNAVLLQASKAIYTAQSTGYNNNNSDLGGQNQIVEILRGFYKTNNNN